MENMDNEKKPEATSVLMPLLNEISESTKSIEQDLIHKIKNDATLKDAFEKLYGEMKLYKENFLQTATKPLVLDLILHYDNLKRKYKKLLTEKDSDTTQKLLLDILEDVADVLYRRDVEIITCNDLKFNRQLQRAIKVFPVADSEKDNDVIEIIRDGFLWQEKILRLQEVTIYKYSTETTHE